MFLMERLIHFNVFQNSLTGKMIPLLNLNAIANPFMQISTEV